MKTLMIASAAAVLLTGSLAHAQFLLGSDENDNKQVTNMYAGQTERSARHSARITGRISSPPRGAFLLGSDDNGNKAVVNSYAAPRRSAARIPGTGGTFRARGYPKGTFLLKSTGPGGQNHTLLTAEVLEREAREARRAR